MNMLVARAQLNVVEEMLAEFANPPQTTQLLALVQAQHVAIVTLLRAVGHVLEKVDADTTRPEGLAPLRMEDVEDGADLRKFHRAQSQPAAEGVPRRLGPKEPGADAHRRGGKSRRAERCFVGRRLFAKQRSNRRWAPCAAALP